MEPRSQPSLDVLFREAAWLRSLARSLVGPDDADDIVQDAWVRALESTRDDGGGARRTIRSARAWMRTVVSNLGRDRLRRGSHRAQRERDAARSEAQPSNEDLAERVELHERLAHAVRSLDEPYRSTLVLRYFEELSVREIAQRQGVPVRTAETRIARGLKQLRTKLDALYGGERELWFGIAAVLAGTGAVARTNVSLVGFVLLLTVTASSVAVWSLSSSGGARGAGPLEVPVDVAAVPSPLQVPVEDTRVAAPPSARADELVVQLRCPRDVDAQQLRVSFEGAGGSLVLAPNRLGQARVAWNPAWGEGGELVVEASARSVRAQTRVTGPGKYTLRIAERRGTLTGRVVDERLQSLADMNVGLWRVESGAVDLDAPDLMTRSDASGSFRFEGVAGAVQGQPGAFTVLAFDDELLSCFAISGTVDGRRDPRSFYVPVATRRAITGTVSARRAPVAGARIAVRTSGEIARALLEPAETGDPNEDALLASIAREFTRASGSLRYGLRVELSTTSALDGSFETFGLRGDDVGLTVHHEAYARWTGAFGAAERSPFVIELEQGATLRGVVREPAGGPLSGVRITLRNDDAKSDRVTKADGRWMFEGVTLDDGALVVFSKVGRATVVDEVPPNAGVVIDRDIVLEPGLRIAGEVAGLFGSEANRRVYLRAEREFDLPFAARFATTRVFANEALFHPPHYGSVRADAEGRFAFDGLGSGRWYVWIVDAQGRLEGGRWVNAGTEGFRLARGGAVFDRVGVALSARDVVADVRLANAAYSLRRRIGAHGDVWSVSANGRFEGETTLLDGLLPGQYSIEFSTDAATYEPASFPVVPGDNRIELEVVPLAMGD